MNALRIEQNVLITHQNKLFITHEMPYTTNQTTF